MLNKFRTSNLAKVVIVVCYISVVIFPIFYFQARPEMDEYPGPPHHTANGEDCQLDVNMDELNLQNMNRLLTQLALPSLILGDYLVVMNCDFDVFIDGEPYLALMVILNKKSGIYKAKLWNQTICVGKKPSVAEFVQICEQHFSRGKPCIGCPQEIEEEGQCEKLLSQIPIPRRVSQDCSKFIKEGFGDVCSECKKLSVSKTFTNVAVTIKDEISYVGRRNDGTLPKQEQNKDEEDVLYGSDVETVNSVGYDPVVEEPELDSASSFVTGSFVTGVFEDQHSKKCPWCKNTISWSGNSNAFQEHRSACLMVVLKKGSKRLENDSRGVHGQSKDESNEDGLKVIEPAREERNGDPRTSLALANQAAIDVPANDTKSCRYCSKTFSTAESATLHKKFVHFWGTFLCTICSKHFNFANDLVLHIQQQVDHREAHYVHCPSCKEELTVTNIANHYKKCVLNEVKKTKFDNDSVTLKLPIVEKYRTAPGQRVICTQCGQSFKSILILSRHNRIHLREQGAEKDDASSEPLYFNCDQCGKQFVSKVGWQLHKKLVHEGVSEDFTCEVCGIAFITRERLWRHKNMHHSTDDTYNCKYCNKRCSTRPWLARHIATKHEEPKFKCNYCDRSFALKKKLESHENEHKGVKPFSCTICTASYTSKEGLHGHKRKKHQKVNISL